eukprot:gene13413-28445_t
MSSFAFGQWIPGAHNCGLVHTYSHRLNEHAGNGPIGPRDAPWTDWCWIPHKCTPELFSRESFCNVVNNRSILIIGDSMSYQMYQALYMQLNEKGNPRNQFDKDLHNAPYICDLHTKLKFIRNDQIIPWSKYNYCMDWWSIVAEYDIIIMNKGAHFIEDGSEYENDTMETINFLKSSNLTYKLIIFRTTPKGSYDLEYIPPDTRPLHTHTTGPVYNETEDKYHYNSFPIRDKFTVEAFRRELNASILNVVPMTSLRPDGHHDPLHYYLPSVIDGWVYMLHNLLMIHHHNHHSNRHNMRNELDDVLI